jgi:hypothetical protein
VPGRRGQLVLDRVLSGTGCTTFLALEECVGKPTGYPDQTGQRFLRP